MTDRCSVTTKVYDRVFRCTEIGEHGQYHVHAPSGWAWFEPKFPPADNPCGATIRVQPQRWAAHACTRAAGHDGAHGDGALLWCDPSPIPQAADMTDYLGWDDDCIDSAVTIYTRPTATEDDLR